VGFEGHRLKIPVSRKSEGTFKMVGDDGHFRILKNGEPYIDEARMEKCSFHAPDQAFVNLSDDCIFNCAFCQSNRKSGATGEAQVDKLLGRVIEAGKTGRIGAVALTSAVNGSTSGTVRKMAASVNRLKNELELPVGVEPYVDQAWQIKLLREAGADEIKINIHSWNRGIFGVVCPEWDFANTISMIEQATEVFGSGKVTSNLIFGLGESDSDMIEGIENLAEMGCIATLRKIRIDKGNRADLLKALGDIPETGPERMLALAEEQKKIIERHGLNPQNLQTMCIPCGCCDIMPFGDI
jgi:biotin synthase-like enzyme